MRMLKEPQLSLQDSRFGREEPRGSRLTQASGFFRARHCHCCDSFYQLSGERCEEVALIQPLCCTYSMAQVKGLGYAQLSSVQYGGR